MSRTTGYRRVFRRLARRARGADARQAVAGAPPAEPAARRFAGGGHGRPLSLPARGARRPGRLLGGLPKRFMVGRYHSLHAERDRMPPVLAIAAETEEDGVIMAVEHRTMPIAAVQFHPESVLTSPGEVGMPILEAALSLLCEPAAAA